MPSAFYTPWGMSQRVERYEVAGDGFQFVESENGKGYIFAEGFAKQHLSKPARDRAVRYGRYLCYPRGDDWSPACTWMIPIFELPRFWPQIFQREMDPTRAGQHLFVLISRFHADYLLERRIPPEKKSYAIWEHTNMERQAIERKCPDAIVTAHLNGDGQVTVMTADGKEHHVREEAFDYVTSLQKRIFLLSDCLAL